MSIQPTPAEQRAALIEWVQEWYAESVICLNNFLMCGTDSTCLRKRMAKVLLLENTITEADGILSEVDLQNLYNRLQCFIELKVVV